MQVVNFVIINNPLVPDSRQCEPREYTEGKALSEYIGELSGEWVISRNGVILDQHRLSEVVPSAGDVIVIAPLLRGGGGQDSGKMVMRLVATVALTAFTYGQGGAYLNGALGTNLTGVSLTAAQAAVSIGGTLLINALLPVTMESEDNDTDYSYGIDGAKNTSQEGVVIPIVYGKHRFAGNIVANHTQQDGDTQYLNMLLNYGEGVVSGFDPDSLLFNDQPIDRLTARPELEFRCGGDDQERISWFQDQIVPYPIENNSELADPATWSKYVTSVDAAVEGLRLDFMSNIFKTTKKGKRVRHYVDIHAEVKPFGDPDSSYFGVRSGRRREDLEKGEYYFLSADGLTAVNPTGKTVVRRKLGTQILDTEFPNAFDFETGKFESYYSSSHSGSQYTRPNDAEGWPKEFELYLIGPSRDFFGNALTKWYDRNDDYDDVSGYEKKVAMWAGIEKNTEEDGGLLHFTAVNYEYGELLIDGKVVGVYNDGLKAYVNKFTDGEVLPWVKDQRLKLSTMIRLTGDSIENVRTQHMSIPLPLDRYEVRVRRDKAPTSSDSAGDTVHWSEINEIVYTEIAYNYTALLAIRTRVTEQFTSIPKVTSIHQGRVIRVWSDAEKRWVPSRKATPGDKYSYKTTPREQATYGSYLTQAQCAVSSTPVGGSVVPNILAFNRPAHLLEPGPDSIYDKDGFYLHNCPAWIAWDMLTDSRYAAGFSPDRLDFWAFKEWADYCVEKNLTFDGVLDSKLNVWDALAPVFRVGRAVPIRTGTRYSVSVEMPKVPVMRFGMDNIVKDSFNTSWLSSEDRANEIELTFYDQEYDNRARIIKLYDKDALARGAQANNTSVTMKGIVREEHAIREAKYSLNCNKLTQMVSFEAPIESLGCAIGDVVLVQHDMTSWGHAGKIVDVVEDGDHWVITLDQEIDLSPSDKWSLTMNHDTVNRGSFTQTGSYGTHVSLSGFTSEHPRATRAVCNGKETAVLGYFDGTVDGVVLEDASIVGAGDSVQLFDTDVVETISFTDSTNSKVTSLRLPKSSFSSAPRALQGFMLGHVSNQLKAFSVRSIGLAGDTLTRRISALEYDERVFDDTTTDFTIGDSTLSLRLPPVQSLAATQEGVVVGGEKKIKIVLSWTHPSASYYRSEVTAVINGERSVPLGEQRDSVSLVVEALDEVSFTITPKEILGSRLGTPTTYQVTANFYGANDIPPRTLSVTPGIGENLIKWDVKDRDDYLNAEVYGISDLVLTGTGKPHDALTDAEIETLSGILTTTSDFSYVHKATERYHYWVRSIDKLRQESEMEYAGESVPLSPVSYNTVTVYRNSATKPAAPTGGVWTDPNPAQSEWTQQPPDQAPAEGVITWVSTRRFSNHPDKADAAWSTPVKMVFLDPPTYTWTCYAEDEQGNGLSETLDRSRHQWVGVAYNKTTQTQSHNPSDYQWTYLVTEEDSPLTLMLHVTGGTVFRNDVEPAKTIRADVYDKDGLVTDYSKAKFRWQVGDKVIYVTSAGDYVALAPASGLYPADPSMTGGLNLRQILVDPSDVADGSTLDIGCEVSNL